MRFGLSVIGLCIAAASPSWAATAAPATQIYTLVSASQSAGGDGTQSVPANTFTPVDAPNTLTCPGPATCRLEAIVWTSFTNGSTKNDFGLCGFVDGALMTEPGGGVINFGGCPSAGTIPADGSLVAATQITAQSQIAPGKHTVQFKVYARGGATIGLYIAEYRLYSQRSAQ